MTIRFMLAAIAMLLFSGCAITPQYKQKPNEKYAKVHSMGYGQLSICVGGVEYTPIKTKRPDTFWVPVNKRVSVKKNIYFSGYYVSHSCDASISFLPQEGEEYIVSSGIGMGRCMVEVVRKDDSKEVGVSFEGSLQESECPR